VTLQGLALNVDPLPQVVHKVLTTAARQPDDSARYDRLQEVRARACGIVCV
jgi:hypothetical protein